MLIKYQLIRHSSYYIDKCWKRYLNYSIQKLQQSTTRIFEIFFRRSKYKRSTSLIPIVGELASRLFGLSTEEDLNILRDNVKRLNTAVNTTLHVQKIQASIANYQKDKIEAISKKNFKNGQHYE